MSAALNCTCYYPCCPVLRKSVVGEEIRRAAPLCRRCRSLCGAPQVTLLGQNIDAWGRDLTPKQTFAELLRDMAGARPAASLVSTRAPCTERASVGGAQHVGLAALRFSVAIPCPAKANAVLPLLRSGRLADACCASFARSSLLAALGSPKSVRTSPPRS
eukprot:3153511-Pleurochrysis_carterae.AAC.2